MNYRSVLVLWVLGALLALPTHAQTNARSPLGVNVRELRYWGTEMHTVDFFKRASNGAGGVWLTQCDWPCNNGSTWNTGEQAQLDLDAQGWPKSLPAASSPLNYRYVATMLWWDSDKLPKGRWTVLYDGEGTLFYGQTGVTRNAAASAQGRDAVDVAAGARSLTLRIAATDPNKTGNYLRNIRVIPPGGTCNGDPFAYAADASACPSSYRPLTETYANQPFHPQFLADLRPFATLRFMQFSSTNLDRNTQWSERSRFDDISWGYNANKGAPFEVALDIANALDASPWLNIPTMAGDDYVVQFARLAKSRLTTKRPIYLEYGNEVWNGMYPYSIGGDWVRDQGMARWPSGTDVFAKRMNWFALRTKQVCALWKQEFADRAGQVKCVMGTQGAGTWVTEHHLLACPLHQAEPGGTACDASAGIDAIAAGYYFGGHVADPVFQSQIEAEWFTQADGGLTKLFQELNEGNALTPPSGWNQARASVALVVSQMAANKAVADKAGIEMVVYEGGNELYGRDTSDYQKRLQTLFEQAERDARMGAAYTAVLNAWKANGGHMYTVFESTGRYSATRGNSTLLEWQGQPRALAPKYDAVASFVEANPRWWEDFVLAPGWNLVGNGSGTAIDVAKAFGNAAKVTTVWKWVAPSARWAFYTPSLQGQALADYAAGKGYDVLTTVAGGEGFWVNAKSALATSVPLDAPVTSASFKAGAARALARGWSLIATGDRSTPGAFDCAIGTTACSAGAPWPTNLTTLWAWNAANAGWYFWAPSLANGDGLPAYLVTKGYSNFATLPGTPAGTLSPTTGFWVNLPQ